MPKTEQTRRVDDSHLPLGAVVEHPEGEHDEPACTAVLIACDVPDALGHFEYGVHDWLVIACDDEPACIGTVASFPTLDGYRHLSTIAA